MTNYLLLAGQVLCLSLIDGALASLCGLLVAGNWIGRGRASAEAPARAFAFVPALRWSALILVLALCVQFCLLTMAMAGVSAPDAILQSMPDVAASHAGRVTLAMLSLSVLLAASCFRHRGVSAIGQTAVCAALLAGLFFFHAALGHAGSDGDFTRAELLQFLHLTGMAVWAGSVSVSALGVLPKLGTASTGEFIASLRRLSTTSAWSASTAILTGALKGWIAINARLANLTQPGWSRILLVKLLFVCIALALGLSHRLRIHDPRAWNAFEKRTLARTLRVEAGCLALVILLSAWLSSSEPPE